MQIFGGHFCFEDNTFSQDHALNCCIVLVKKRETESRLVTNEGQCGNSTFSIHKTETTTKTCGVTVYFEDKNLDTTVEKLMQQGIQFEQLPIDQPWLWREAHLSDPDGNKIILYHAGVNRTNPPWKLKNRSDAFFK